ncbi:MAG: ATP synthase F1 subunit gamma [Candidatus Aminicenantes bacterium RBG_16_63_16]|nr:MAG: ATP synthase F1 subunit gamma [Candidatus Aminicenantes bacterium RBG_16_63_16]
MPALIDLRRRIRSVRNTQQITQAMKTVSTAKFKKAQRSVLDGRPLWHNLPSLLERVAAWAGRQVSPLLDVRDEKKLLAVIITSDKGLCGAFNSNLLSRADAFLDEKAPAEASLILVGKKAVNHFRKKPYPVLRAYGEKADKLTVRELKEIAHLLRGQYVFGRTDSVYIIYNEFKSILAPRVTFARVLPVPAPERPAAGEELAPDWEPATGPVLQSLLELYLETQVFHAYFESAAAEQAARMMAMENATKNAEELIGDLVLGLNKIRQASITKELLEIMTAVDAMAK